MQIQKKVMMAAALLAAATVFAQKSMTSRSTLELFGTDVDDFMDVNEWSNVEPRNFFGFLGYGENGRSNIELGAAHQFKPVYFGTYFEGQLPGWSKKNNPTQAVLKTDDGTEATGKLLFGFGNVGLRADVKFKPDPNDNKITETKTTGEKKTQSDFLLQTDFTAGINFTAKDRLFKISPFIGLASQVDKEEETKKGDLTKLVDKSVFVLVVGSGFSHDFFEKDDITQTVKAELKTEWSLYPIKTDVMGGGCSNDRNLRQNG